MAHGTGFKGLTLQPYFFLDICGMVGYNIFMGKKTGPKLKTHCKHGHKLTDENTYQTYSSNGAKNGRKCMQCNSRMSASHRERFPEKAYKGRIESQMRHRYGIDSLEERDAILADQGGKCLICERTDCTWGKGFNDVWHIDHKHDGTVGYRGILCGRCNVTLGHLESTPEMLQKFINYAQQ